MPRILIPTALRNYAGKNAELELPGATVGEMLSKLAERYPELRRHLYDDRGGLRSFVALYLNDEDVRHLQKADTPVSEKDVLSIVPSVAGGTDLSNDEILRYSRHLIMPEVGIEGQRRLKDARVLCVGAGGLGSPAGLYLAAAGVGTLGLVDFDTVDYTNLQRQVLYSTADVGRPKLEAAVERLRGVNPHIELVPHETRIHSGNALDLVRRYDYVVDGTDNFPTRYLMNDASVLAGKVNVYASIFRFEGQVAVFGHPDGPCYRCVYPDPPPPGLVPSCAEGGVLGVLPGIVGALQAAEAIKLILGAGEPLVGRLLLVDVLAMSFRTLKVRKDPACPVCGADPTVRELIDYEQFCGLGGDPPAAGAEWNITAVELKRRLDAEPGAVEVIDVREPHEWDICRIEGARLLPLSEFASRVNELDSSRAYVLQCHHGMRSMRALGFLRECGFKKLKNLAGGIDAWAAEVEPGMPRY